MTLDRDWSPHGQWMVFRSDGEPLDEDWDWGWAGHGPTPDWATVGGWFDLLGEAVEVTAMRLAVTDVEVQSFGFVVADHDENQLSLFDDEGRHGW